jgi:hypothetical protein
MRTSQGNAAALLCAAAAFLTGCSPPETTAGKAAVSVSQQVSSQSTQAATWTTPAQARPEPWPVSNAPDPDVLVGHTWTLTGSGPLAYPLLYGVTADPPTLVFESSERMHGTYGNGCAGYTARIDVTPTDLSVEINPEPVGTPPAGECIGIGPPYAAGERIPLRGAYSWAVGSNRVLTLRNDSFWLTFERQ